MEKQEEQMDWPAILAEVHRRGMTLGHLADMHGIPRGSMNRIKAQAHYRSQEVIAAFIDRKPEELWPSRYPKRTSRILDTVKYPKVAKEIAQPGADKSEAA
jgi:Ner family transcriptional regulator